MNPSLIILFVVLLISVAVYAKPGSTAPATYYREKEKEDYSRSKTKTKIKKPGRDDKDDDDRKSSGRKKPEDEDCVCGKNPMPVCGRDRKTYPSKCEMERKGVRLSHCGECLEQ